LIRSQYNFAGFQRNVLAADQVIPVFGVDQIDVRQRDMVGLQRDIVERKDALLAINALAPESKNTIAQVQGKLRRIGVKCRLSLPDGNQ